MKNLAENGDKLTTRNSLTWTNNRYGKRCVRVLCPSITGASRTNSCSKLSKLHVPGVLCGMWIEPGTCINFSKNYSWVVNKITFCILLLMVILFGYSAKIVNVETAFLYVELDEEIFMECSQGISDRRKQLHHFVQVHLPCSSSEAA